MTNCLPAPMLRIKDLVRLTTLSGRELARRHKDGDIPGWVKLGRRTLLFHSAGIAEWISLGLPRKEEWDRLHESNATV